MGIPGDPDVGIPAIPVWGVGVPGGGIHQGRATGTGKGSTGVVERAPGRGSTRVMEGAPGRGTAGVVEGAPVLGLFLDLFGLLFLCSFGKSNLTEVVCGSRMLSLFRSCRHTGSHGFPSARGFASSHSECRGVRTVSARGSAL